MRRGPQLTPILSRIGCGRILVQIESNLCRVIAKSKTRSDKGHKEKDPPHRGRMGEIAISPIEVGNQKEKDSTMGKESGWKEPQIGTPRSQTRHRKGHKAKRVTIEADVSTSGEGR